MYCVVLCMCVCVRLCCTHGSPAICSPLRDTWWWRLSHPLAQIRAILPPFKTRPLAMPRSQGHYGKHALNWFCSANTISWCPKIINIRTPNLTKEMGLDGELRYENPASMSWTSSLVARGQREGGNGYDKPEMTEQRKKAVERGLTWTATVAAGGVLWGR